MNTTRRNPDGSITVGILSEEDNKEQKAVEKVAEAPKKKPTKKSK